MVFYGIVWPFMTVYGFMATYRFGLVWSFLAVIDPNSFGLVLLRNLKITFQKYFFFMKHLKGDTKETLLDFDNLLSVI